jgi:hypothetical protein
LPKEILSEIGSRNSSADKPESDGLLKYFDSRSDKEILAGGGFSATNCRCSRNNLARVCPQITSEKH